MSPGVPGQQRRLPPGALPALLALCCACPVPGPGRGRPSLAQAATLAALQAGRLPGVFHRVRPGETLASIARAYAVSAQWLAEINGHDAGAPLQPGEDLFVPGVRPPARAEPEPPQERVGLAWPLSGVITSRFGPRRGRHHDGIDLAAPRGTPIRAAADGVVLYSGRLGNYGRVVLVKHKGRVVTLYAHNQRNLVRVGERVRRGDTLARVGTSGNATGPHVHFEVRIAGRPRDPLAFVR